MIEIKGLIKSYGDTRVLDGVSFKIEPTSLVALVGPNGVGKSTLMKLLMRIETPEAGEAKICGLSIHDDNPHFNRHVGYVSESVDFTLKRPMRDLMKFVAGFYPRWNLDIFDKLAGQFRLPIERRFQEISRGQRMQFVFALAAASQPEVLLLDEVTAVLDASVRLSVMNYLKSYTQKGGTVLLATNILSEVHNFADRLIILNNGKVGFDQPTLAFPQRFSKLRRQRLEASPVFDDTNCRPVGVNSDGSMSYLMPKSKVSEYSLSDGLFDQRGITPEDLFVYFTKKAG